MKYKVITYIGLNDVPPEDYDYFVSSHDAVEEIRHMSFLQPENIYMIEAVSDEDVPESAVIIEPIKVVKEEAEVPVYLEENLRTLFSLVADNMDSHSLAFSKIKDILSDELGY